MAARAVARRDGRAQPVVVAAQTMPALFITVQREPELEGDGADFALNGDGVRAEGGETVVQREDGRVH